MLDSTDSGAIQAETKKHGISLPIVYAVDPDWEKTYQVKGVSRTVYYSNDFKIAWSGIGLDEKSVGIIAGKIQSNPRG